MTTAFSTLSENVIELVGWFRNRDRREVAEILDGIQQKEKQKLQLVCVCACVVEMKGLAFIALQLFFVRL